MRKLILATLLLGSTLMANAQSGTNSPYSQYGLGVLSDQTSGFNRGMNGVGLGFHEHNQVNFLNPASYASIDSLSFIFDAGLSMQVTNFEEGGVKKNANNSNFEYVVAGLRLRQHLGLSFGVLPFTNVGYSYSSTSKIGSVFSDGTHTTTYSGSGGLHQAYVGLGWSPVKGLSIGANISYLWGNYSRSVYDSKSISGAKTETRLYSAEVNSYKLDLGAQYTARLGKKDWATLGVTYTPGHGLGASADMSQYYTDSQTSVSDTTSFSIAKALAIPDMWGVGLMWNHDGKWKVGIDYSLQKWGSLGYPVFNATASTYTLQQGVYTDRHKVNLGLQYCYGERNRNFIKRVQYRAGVSYATPYFKVNGHDGPKELSVSAGFGIPVFNNYNNRSYLNISGQWVKSSAQDLIKENTFRLNIGFTFNEEWFRKWRMR